MSGSGCPYDNAAMENFFGTLKSECLHRMEFSNRAEVEQAIAEYVQIYNMTGLLFVGKNHRLCRWYQKALAMGNSAAAKGPLV